MKKILNILTTIAVIIAILIIFSGFGGIFYAFEIMTGLDSAYLEDAALTAATYRTHLLQGTLQIAAGCGIVLLCSYLKRK